MQVPETEIIITKDSAELLRKTVRPGDYVIGREEGCDLLVEAELVSRRHAQLIVNFDHVLIEDLGSSNGTFVNGEPVKEPTRLWPNQKVQIGTARLELRRIKTVPPPDVSLAPQTAAVQRLLPEEFLREKKYDIGKVVAQGGMGAILDAQDAATERRVAMKVMLDGSSPDDLTRFVAEAKVTAQLEHPSIVPVYELSVDENDQVFYTMKMVRGITLRKVLELLADNVEGTKKKYPLPALLTIFQKACDAIAFAHSKGVIHRDLKPENIMLDDFGVVLVMDWGLAKRMRDEGGRVKTEGPSATAEEDAAVEVPSPFNLPTSSFGVTLAGTVMGTPQYMSPEQARGEVETLDARSDVYALGTILYQMLSLRAPVSGNSAMEIVSKVAEGESEPLTTAKDRPIPESLAAVVRKAMAFERDHRYRQVADLQHDIEAYQNGRATSAENAGLAKQLVLLVRRHKAIFSTAALAWLIITALAVWFVIRITASERETRRQAEIAKQNEAQAVEQREEARKALAGSALALAEAARREADGGQMRAALNQVPEDLRDSTWHYLLDQSDTSISRVHLGSQYIDGVAPDPQRPGIFAAVTKSGKVFLINVRTGEQLLEFPVGPARSQGNYRLAFSTDGARIAVGHSGTPEIAIYNAADGTKLLEWKASFTYGLQFNADRQTLLQISNDGTTLSLWDTATGALRWNHVQAGRGMKALLTPDGQHIVICESPDHVQLLSAQDGTLERKLSGEWASAMALRPDGRELILGLGNGEVKGIAMQDGKLLFDIRTGERGIDNLAFTPDGTRFVSQAPTNDGRQNLQVWDGMTGAHLQTLLGGSGSVNGLAVHPATGELLVAGPESKVWDLTGVPEKWTLKYGAWDSGAAFWGSDDLILAATTGTTNLYKLQAGSPTEVWKPPQSTYRHPSVSADGRFAALDAPESSYLPLIVLRKTGESVEQVVSFKPAIPAGLLRLSPHGDRLLSIDLHRHASTVFDAFKGTQVVTLEWKDIQMCNDAGWVDDGRGIVGLVTIKTNRGNAGSEEWVVRWDVATGKIVQRIMNATPMDVLAVTADGKRLAEGGADKQIRVRDAGTLAVEKEFRAHDGPITALAWHPAKLVLASSSTDLAVRLWDVDTGRRLEELRGPVSYTNALAFSPSGRRLACAGNDSTTRVWEPQSLNEHPSSKTEEAGWENLMAPLTPGSIAQIGHGWRLEGGALLSPGRGFSVLPLGAQLAGKSYQVRMKLRELTPKESFDLLLPIGNNTATLVLDGWPNLGRYTALNRIGDKEGKDLPGAVKGKVIHDADEHDLDVTVRLEGAQATVTSTFDGAPLYQWSGPSDAPRASERWVYPPGILGIGSMSADWVVYEIKLKRL